MTFRELGLSAPILTALEEQGYETPSPIQEGAIPPALLGRDVLGCAQTGTGKTCAFATPILQRLDVAVPGRPIRALILTPTRELAIQIGDSFTAYGSHLPLRTTVIFGGVSQVPQVEKLKKGVDILVATPGRLGDLYQQRLLDLSRIEIFVLDEADRMLDMGFIHDVKKILKWLPTKKQTLFFSATMPPEITELVDSLLHDPARVAVNPVSSPVDAIRQSVYLVDKGNKGKLLAKLVRDLGVKNALVFTRTKHGANKVARDLEKDGISAAAIHGNKSQTARQQALGDFKAGKIKCLVATDIAARGLDIEELSHVFNFNLPEVAETYVHRIGRTGRAGREGEAVAFCDFGEQPLLKEIEKLMGRKVPVVDSPWPIQVFEAPKKDKNGRIVNEEDEEARAAARQLRRERAEADQAATRQKKQRTAETAITAVPDAQAPAKRKRKRKTSGGEAPVEQLAAPAQRQAPKRGVRPGSLVDTGDAMPQNDLRRPDPMSGDRILDATARLLAPRRSSTGPAAPQRQEDRREGERKADKRPAAQQQSAAPQKSGNRAPAAAPAKGKGGRSGDRRGRPGGPGRGPVEPNRSPAETKDSTEHPTLMKPYYLDIK